MASARKITIEFIGNDRSLGKTVSDVEGKTSKMGGKLQKVGSVAGKALAGGAVLAAGALYKMGQAAAEDEQAQVQLATALRNNAKATDAQVAATEDWISAQGKALGVADDELRPALAKLVAATKDVGEAQRLSSIAMDVSAGTGKSLEQVTTALIKAQNGQVSGLSRLGIKVQDSEKDAVALKAAQIAQTKAQHAYNDALKEFGAGSREAKEAASDLEYRQMKLGEAQSKSKKTTIDFTEAQKRLTDAYGGQAAKAADTAAGKQKRLQVALGELGEEIGAKTLPLMLKLAGVGLKMVDWVTKNQTTVGVLVVAIAGFAAALWAANAAISAWNTITKVATGLQKAWNFAMAMNPIGLVVIAIAALVAGLIIAYKKSETFRRIVNGALGAVKKFAVAAFDKIVGAAQFVWNWLKKNWPLLLAIITGPIGMAVYAIAKSWDKIKNSAGAAKDWIVTKFNNLVGWFKALPTRITNVASGMFDGIRDAFKGAINWIINAWNDLEFSIPGFDWPGPGKFDGITIGTPNLPTFAKGGISQGGAAIVGEQGPELVTLPRGANVLSARRTANAMSGPQIVFTGPVYGDPRAFARAIVKALQDAKRIDGVGLTAAGVL